MSQSAATERAILGAPMMWRQSFRCDDLVRPLADRHYNRQSVGAVGFVPPGRCLVLRASAAFWVTSWPFAEYVKHRWPGAWVCSAFRREGGDHKASDMIRAALAATRWKWPAVPALGMVTFLDSKCVKPIKVRGVETWGRTWLLAGFEPDGETEGGLLAFRITEDRMPAEEPPIDGTLPLFGGTP